MKKIALALILALFPSLAWAQCTGVAPAQTICGNNTGSGTTPSFKAIGSFPTLFADPSASVGLVPVDGTATTAMRSDSAPPLSTATQTALTGTTNQLLLGQGIFGFTSLGTLGTTTTVLHGNASGAPSFGAVNLTSDVSNILPVPNGGTGLASGTSGGIPYYNTGTTIQSTSALSLNNPVIGGGVGGAPTTGTRSGNTTSFATTSGTLTSGQCAQFDASGNIVQAASSCTGSTPPACVKMWPSAGQSAGSAWNVVDAYGNNVTTTGTNSQGLQEAINFSIANGQCLEIYGQGPLQRFQGNGTTHTNTTVDGISSTANMLAGDFVTGAGIPAFTTIATVNSGTQITLSQAATASATVTITVTRAAGANLHSNINSSVGITIPASEQWTLRAYDVNLTFSSAVNGPGVSIDSAIIDDIQWFGQIVYQPASPSGASSCVVYMKPVNAVPLDGIITIGASKFYISNIASVAGSGTANGIWCVDLTNGGVNNNQFGSVELNGTSTTNYGFIVTNTAATTAFSKNIIDFTDIHLTKLGGFQLGTATLNQANLNGNTIRLSGILPNGASSTGIDVYGVSNTFNIGSISNEEGTLQTGIKFESTANFNTGLVGKISGQTGSAISDSGTNNLILSNGGPQVAWGVPTGGTGATSLTGLVKGNGTSPMTTVTAPTGAVVGTTDTQTLTNKTLTSPVISGGTIDNAVIGGTTPAAVTATILKGQAGNSSSNVRSAGMLSTQVTSAGTPASTVETDLQTVTLPTNLFDATGRGIRFRAWGTTGADANTKTVRMYFGAANKIYDSTGVTTNGAGWMIEGEIYKIGANSQSSFATGIFANSWPATFVQTNSQTESGTIVLKITGQNGTATANDIVCAGLTVEVLN